jgi:undecaprenyl-diphosphatase
MHLTIWQTILLALLQGVTELFPISSLGHTVIIPGLLGWGNLETDTACGGQSCFLPIIVALHLGTAIALVIYFWRDWLQVLRSVFTAVKDAELRKGTDEWVSFMVILGCIPAGLIGVFLETPLKQLFASPLLASTFLVVNGSLLFLGERMRLRSESRETNLSPNLNPKEREAKFRSLSSLSVKEALIVGCAQSLALIPGLSRSGTTMVAGLGIRLTHEDAARFSFLLGTPIIGAAAALEVPQLINQSTSVLELVFLGMVLAGVAAFVSTKFLMKYFETGRLYPFAYYCWGAGLLSLALFFFVFHAAA